MGNLFFMIVQVCVSDIVTLFPLEILVVRYWFIQCSRKAYWFMHRYFCMKHNLYFRCIRRLSGDIFGWLAGFYQSISDDGFKRDSAFTGMKHPTWTLIPTFGFSVSNALWFEQADLQIWHKCNESLTSFVLLLFIHTQIWITWRTRQSFLLVKSMKLIHSYFRRNDIKHYGNIYLSCSFSWMFLLFIFLISEFVLKVITLTLNVITGL